MSGVVADNRENLKESIQNLKAASARLDNTLDAAGRVMAKIDRGEGTLGMLVNDNSAHGSITDTLEGINKYVRKSEQLKTFIDYRLEWQERPSEFKHYVNLRLQPTADKYYTIGVVDDPRGRFSSSTIDGHRQRHADDDHRGEVQRQAENLRPDRQEILRPHGEGRA